MGQPKRPLRMVITTGPTREPLDPVRFLSNYSTGYMGAQLTREALLRGHTVTVIRGPSEEPLPAHAQTIEVETSQEMERALRMKAPRADAVIMAAAVSDFRLAHPSPRKRPRRATLHLRLEATPDIIARLPRRRRQIRVGFALESEHVVRRATAKLHAKHLDVVLAQRVHHITPPFGRQRVEAWLLDRDGQVCRVGYVSKRYVARVLLDKIEGLWYGQRSHERSTES